jgi:ATP-dependent DNA ligase
MIERELAQLPVGTVLDGEVVDFTGKANGGDWSRVQSVLGADNRTSTTATYVVFDCLALMGEDVRLHPLVQRRAFLAEMLGDTGGYSPDFEHIHLIDQVPYNADTVAALIDNGWEGAIVKDPAATYASGKRGHGWIKVKATETEDVVVMGATDGNGKYGGMIGALVFGQYARTTAGVELVVCGQCSGMTDAERLHFTRLAGEGQMIGTVIEIQHMGRMPSGGLRHPQYLRLRTDKLAAECVA